MRWVPERPINPACSQGNLFFHQRAVDHETEHVRRSQDVMIEQPDVWTFGSGVVRYPSCPS